MKRSTFILYAIILLSLLAACVSNNATQDTSTDEDKVATIVAGTLSSIPSPSPILTETLVPMPTNTPVQTLAPLYSEITWENLGRSEQEISVNWLTNERITLAGYTYQAPFPAEKNDLANNVYMYYSNENMANMGWMFVGGWGGTTGILTEFYNETGYFLTIRHTSGQSQSVIIWISDQTDVVPVISTTQN